MRTIRASRTARPRFRVAATAGAALVLAALSLGAQDETGTDRIARLVAAMTLDEKVSMLRGAGDPDGVAGAGYLPGVPRLGVPALRFTDGPAGVRTNRPATALPAPLALAATFDVDLARQYGRVIALEARAHGQHVLLGPAVNLARVPQAGRNFETFGEDPLLTSRLAVAEIEGLQGGGVIAAVKHFVAANQEAGRGTLDVRVGARALREGELLPFEAAVDAGVGAVVTSESLLDGTPASEHGMLLTDVLKRQWNFRGFVVSAWGTARAAGPALLAGLDVEMPRGTQFAGMNAAVTAGQVPAAAIDDAVTRILRQMDRAGLLPDGGAPPSPPSLADVRAHAQAAREIAAAGAVLLRNEGDVLPLRREDLASVLVIGPTAERPLVGGGGRARVTPVTAESALVALRRRAGAGQVRFEPGLDLDGVTVPAEVLGGEPIDATRGLGLPAGTTRTWNATLRAPADGTYTLMLQADRGQATLQIDDQLVIGESAEPAPGTGLYLDGVFGGLFPPSSLETAAGLQTMGVTRVLERGREYAIVVTATAPANRPQHLRLAWVTPDAMRARVADAVAAARTARVAIVFAHDEGAEGRDRGSLALPAEQDALIAAVAAVNPRTVVVLNTGGPVLMPWLPRVKAVLQTWYAGQDGGPATAAMLTGDLSPGGRLPMTFPRRLEDTPTFAPERYPGIEGRVEYEESLFGGYRGYDQTRVAPLFPFGHGLSYTRFSYGGVSARADDAQAAVTFTVRNTGGRAGSEVAQIYVEPPTGAPVALPVRVLAGFVRVTLRPGESRTVTVPLDDRALSYWSEADGRWIRVGHRPFVVGSSSRDVRLRGIF